MIDRLHHQTPYHLVVQLGHWFCVDGMHWEWVDVLLKFIKPAPRRVRTRRPIGRNRNPPLAMGPEARP